MPNQIIYIYIVEDCNIKNNFGMVGTSKKRIHGYKRVSYTNIHLLGFLQSGRTDLVQSRQYQSVRNEGKMIRCFDLHPAIYGCSCKKNNKFNFKVVFLFVQRKREGHLLDQPLYVFCNQWAFFAQSISYEVFRCLGSTNSNYNSPLMVQSHNKICCFASSLIYIRKSNSNFIIK